MSVSRQRALVYADHVISMPKAHVRCSLRQIKGGITLIHNGKTLTRCYLTQTGMKAAVFMSQALGIELPALGKSVEATVSTGVLWRAVSISCLDFRKTSSYELLERLLNEAKMQRGMDGASGL